MCNANSHLWLFLCLVGTEETGCSAIFGHSQFFYSATELIFNVGKYLLPVWAILVVFQPVENSTSASDITISGGYNLVSPLYLFSV